MWGDELIFFPERDFDELPDALGQPYTDVEILTEDGVRLHGWWIGDPKNKTTAIHFHGNAGNISHRLDRIRSLGPLPMRFLMVDYRGYGKSEGKPSEKGIYKDAMAVYRFLAETHKLKPEEIVIWGTSLGGAAAIDLASQKPSACVVLESTFTSLKAMAAVAMPFIPSFMVPDGYRSIDKIKKIRVPIFISHGELDEVIPFFMGKELFEAANEPKKFLAVPGARHNDLYQVGGEEYRQHLACALKNER